jgi:hypothetical protein
MTLVSERMMKPAEAVIQLSTVPAEPGKQKQWVMEKMRQAIQAQKTQDRSCLSWAKFYRPN